MAPNPGAIARYAARRMAASANRRGTSAAGRGGLKK